MPACKAGASSYPFTGLCRKNVLFCSELARRKQAELSRNLATFLSLDSVQSYLVTAEQLEALRHSCELLRKEVPLFDSFVAAIGDLSMRRTDGPLLTLFGGKDGLTHLMLKRSSLNHTLIVARFHRINLVCIAGSARRRPLKTETMMPQIEFPSQLQFSLGGASAQCVRACSGEGEGERERGRLSLGRLRLRQLLLRHFEFTQ